MAKKGEERSFTKTQSMSTERQITTTKEQAGGYWVMSNEYTTLYLGGGGEGGGSFERKGCLKPVFSPVAWKYFPCCYCLWHSGPVRGPGCVLGCGPVGLADHLDDIGFLLLLAERR